MITHTFSHIKGITSNFEKQLRDKGVFHWNDFFEKMDQLESLPKGKIEKIKAELPISMQALARNDLEYFKILLKPNEHWRLSKFGKIAFVDIETTGLSYYSEEITVLGIYDGSISHLYVNGKNLRVF